MENFVVFVLTAAAVASVIWAAIQSRKNVQPSQGPDATNKGSGRPDHPSR